MGKEYTRDATEHGQIMIAEAIQALASSSGGSSAIEEELIEANGYIKLSNGLIIQWGQVGGGELTSESEGEEGTVNFPIEFTTCFGINLQSAFINMNMTGPSGANISGYIKSLTNTSFGYATSVTAYSDTTVPPLLWIAIGV